MSNKTIRRTIAVYFVQELDHHLVRSWITKCENYHIPNSISGSSKRYRDPIDIILIDVVELRLVGASSSYRFLALNYIKDKYPCFRRNL